MIFKQNTLFLAPMITRNSRRGGIGHDNAANVLEIREVNVKVYPHRTRVLVRKSLYARAGMERKEAFNLYAVRCDHP